MSFDPELEAFKHIDLRDFAAGMGYTLDRRESWRGSAVMRNHGDDKIVIKRNTNGHFVYFSVRDEADNGTIIDFLQRRERLTLGNLRKKIRAWSGSAASLPAYTPLQPTPKDRLTVERNYRTMQEAPAHPYLVEERGLSPALLNSPRFLGRIRVDGHRNAVFPHFDSDGLSGYELKNRAFTGFAAGGEKGLWFSHIQPDDHRLVFAESAIDALSYAMLFPDTATRYASIGGKPNPAQPDLIKSAIAKMPTGSEVIAAMDADADGAGLASLIETAFNGTSRPNLTFRVHFPGNQGQDWNDVLRQSRLNFFPVAQL